MFPCLYPCGNVSTVADEHGVGHAHATMPNREKDQGANAAQFYLIHRKRVAIVSNEPDNGGVYFLIQCLRCKESVGRWEGAEQIVEHGWETPPNDSHEALHGGNGIRQGHLVVNGGQ